MYYHRYLMDEVKKWLARREILAIKGPRQSGKTTLLYMIRDHLIGDCNVKKENILYITFEDRDILDQFSRDPKEYVKRYLPIGVAGEDGRFYLLIDEFHYLKDGGQKLKFLYDSYENVKFIITGSSSLELVGHTAKHLVGRVFMFNLFPFGFGELVEVKEMTLHKVYKERSAMFDDFLRKGKLAAIKDDIFEKDFGRLFEEYVQFGGYPEVLKTADFETKHIILKNIYDTYITKDILELLRVKEVSDFRTIVGLLANTIGGLVNYNDLATDGKSYFRKVKEYMSILEETYVIRTLRPHFGNMTTELKKNPKVYFVDSGIRNYIVNNFNGTALRPDGGRLVEQAVLAGLAEKEGAAIKYWRTRGKAEVDFILTLSGEVIPIEIKYSALRSPEVSRGMRSFIAEYAPERAVILTKGFWGEMRIGKSAVRFVPVWCV